MSADHQAVRVPSQGIWHVKEGTLELSFASLEPPPRPEWVAEDAWYGGSGEKITATFPIRKAVTSAPTGIARTGVDPVTGQITFVKYTWNGSAWANPVPCDSNGNPI